MTKVVLLAPRRADGGHRDRLWTHSRAVWAELFPNWPIFEGHHSASEGPFNRSAAINRAAELAGKWDVCVVIDCDVLPSAEGVESAVEHALRTGGPASGHNGRKNLNQKGTDMVLGGYHGSWERFVHDSHDLCNSGALVVRRDLWDDVTGFDELFRGWGFEDTAMEAALETVSGEQLWKAPADLWHLWHPNSPEKNQRLPAYRANRARRDRYLAARGDKDAMHDLLWEAADVKPLPLSAFERPTTIPRILHRTVPEEPSREAEDFWYKALSLHPGWQAMDHHDPLFPLDWPETSALWKWCSSGAQKAGLIRLEALWVHGGIYLDSDFECYRSFEPLLDLQGFAAWEDNRCVPDAVMGFRPGHPAVAEMLRLATEAVRARRGAWESGPGVSTTVLPGREDVLLLPPGSLYPYHYKEKHRRDEQHAAEQPWAFGAHHWAHSWAGK